MNKFLQWAGKALIAGIIAIFLLSVFCVVYAYDGIHTASNSGATDYVWESGQLKSTMKEGFSWIKMDSYGYNNAFDYSQQPDILLMGSSHMEAVQVAEDENVGYLLNEMLPNYRTYNIGMSGHTIYRCMDNLGNALQAYCPEKYLVMVIDSVDLSVNEMESVIAGDTTPIPSYDNGVIYYLQKIPAIKVIYKQIVDWISLESQSKPGPSEDTKSVVSNKNEKYDTVLSEFLGDAAALAREFDVTLMIVYQPAQKLGKNDEVVYEHSEEKRQRFALECEEQGIVFCDMTESFDKLYYEEDVLAHGFSNTSIGEGHLNKYGHASIAKMIVLQIQELEAE